MAAVDRRMGMIRRGTTPAAPKPINLPSQKLENQGLVPDVEIVPRGTFCWGRAGRSSAASDKNNERMDSAPILLESNGTVDNVTDAQHDLVSHDEVQGLDEQSNSPQSVESSTLPISSPACITPLETNSASSSNGENDVKLDSGSSAASDTGSLPKSVLQTSCSESGTSPLATPVTFNETWDGSAKNVQVEEPKHCKSFPAVFCEGSENVSNLESKQGTHGGHESLPGCQDFGYFEGFYSNNHAFFSPGISYSNGSGMTFGPGLHAEPSQHDGFYSFLGVPYYDSTKDKEIVVITMVGNPGFHGNYLPHPGLPDQYGRPTLCGTFPLQFGHFDNFAVPGQNILHGRHHMSAEMNSMCSGEQGEFVCFEQGYYKDAWLNGNSVGDVQRGNGAYLPIPFSMCKNSPNLQDYNIPKRARSQKSAFRNKRAAPKEASSAALKPGRRVTLLTKVSQHEVIISSLQKSKPIGNKIAGGFSSAPSFSECVTEASSCDTQCETAIAESSSADRVNETVDIVKSHVSDVSRGLLAHEIIPQQSVCTGSNNADSALLSSHDMSCLKSEACTSVSQSSSTTVSTLAFHEDAVATSCPGAARQVPAAPSTKTSEVTVEEDSPKCETKHAILNVNGHIMNAAELPQDDLTESADHKVNEHVNREETLCTTIVALMPHKHNQGSMSRLSNHKSETKWRRKGVVTIAKLGQECLDSKAQQAVVYKKTSTIPSTGDKAFASANTLPNATVGTKTIPQCNLSLSSCVPSALFAGEASAVSKEKLDTASSLNWAVSESASDVKKSKKVHKAIPGNVDLESVAESSLAQIPESYNKLAIKTLPFADGRNLNLNGSRKEWRQKLPGAGNGKSATEASGHQASKAAVTIKFSELQESKLCLTGIHGDLKHRLEVSCYGDCVDESKEHQQNEGCDTLSLAVDRQQTAKMMASTCVTGFNSNNLAEKYQKVECNSEEILPLRFRRVEQRRNAEKLIGEQKTLQQEPPASKPEELNFTCRRDTPMNNNSLKAYSGHSDSSDNQSGIDHKVSKVPKTSNFTSSSKGFQPVSSLQTQVKSKEMEDSSYSSQESVSQPVLATQCSDPKELTREVNQSSKAALWLRWQSLVRNYQEQKQVPVNKVAQGHAGPGHIMEKNQRTGSMARSVPNFVSDCMRQGHYVTSWRERKIGSPLEIFRYKTIDQNHGRPQEAHFKGQSMCRWQEQKVWSRKVTHAQEQKAAATTGSSLSKPCEGCCTFSDGKPCAENKKHISSLGGASRVSWKPKIMSSVQGSKGQCKEGGKDNPSSSASQNERTPGECLPTEYSGNTPFASPCENEQQLNKQVSGRLTPYMKEASDMCLAASCNTAQSSLSCGSGQQVDNLGNHGLMKPASQSNEAFEELPTAVPSSSCGNGQHISDIDRKESFKCESQMKMGPEECPIVASSSCTTMSTPCGNWQQTGDTVDQSYRAVVEMEHSAVIKKATLPVEQAVFGPISQPVSVVSISSKLQDIPLASSVKKPHQNHTSWRPKTVSGSIAVKSASSKEVNENDPSASTHVEGAPKKLINPLPASIFAASNDLHVWKNNGRHPVRASYGLPYWRKGYSQLQKPLDQQAKFHGDSATSLELPDRVNTTCLARESPKVSKGLVVKEMKQTKLSPSREHPVSKSRFSQHHVYGVKHAHFISNEHSTVGNRRPFSMKSNFSHDDNKKIAHHQPLVSRMCLPMEQGYRRPVFGKSFSYDDNRRAVHHQQFLPLVPNPPEQVKVSENSYAQGMVHLESLSRSRSNIKPIRHGQLHNGRKFADSDKKGWVVKTEARCSEC